MNKKGFYIRIVFFMFVFLYLGTNKTQAQTLRSFIDKQEEKGDIVVDLEIENTNGQQNIKAFVYSRKELFWLSRLIQSEGGIESYDCMLKIGSVVLNRRDDAIYPDSIEDVIFDNEPTIQFSVTIGDEGNRPIDCVPGDAAVKAAKELLREGSILPKEVLIFYSSSCDSAWINNRKTYEVVDHTVFAYTCEKEN